MKVKHSSAITNRRVRRLLSHAKPGQPCLAVTPGGYNPKYKLWPADRFEDVIAHAVTKGITVFVLGSRDESNLAWRLHDLIRSRPLSWRRKAPGNLSFLNGVLRLEEIPDFLQTMTLHLSNDNGVAQIAGAINRPQIVLYHGTESPHRTLGLSDQALFSGIRFDMTGISTTEVIRALDRLI